MLLCLAEVQFGVLEESPEGLISFAAAALRIVTLVFTLSLVVGASSQRTVKTLMANAPTVTARPHGPTSGPA